MSVITAKIDRDFYAVGQGSEYTMCAMFLGENPEEAILIANEFHYHINDKINKIEFKYE